MTAFGWSRRSQPSAPCAIRARLNRHRVVTGGSARLVRLRLTWGIIIRDLFGRVPRETCQREGRGFESRRPLQRNSRSEELSPNGWPDVRLPSALLSRELGSIQARYSRLPQPNRASEPECGAVTDWFGVSSKSAISCPRLAIKALPLLVSDVVPKTDEPTRSASRCRPCCLSHS